MKLHREIPSWMLLLGSVGLSAWAWPRVSEPMAIHWNLQGAVDGWGSRAVGLGLPPLLSAALYGVLWWVPRLGENHALFERAYDVLRTAILAFLLGVQGIVVATALGFSLDVLAAVGGLCGALFVVVGNTLGKLRPNAYAGVRTPWTLTSKLSWTKTHRLAGFLFIGTGLLTLGVAPLSGPMAIGALLVGTLGSTVVSAAYSWRVWRQDPERGLR